MPSEVNVNVARLDRLGIPYRGFSVDPDVLSDIADRQPLRIEVKLPTGQLLALDRAELFTGAEIEDVVDRGVHYRGRVVGSANSLAVVSFFAGELHGLLQSDDRSMVFGPVRDRSYHLFYDDGRLPLPASADCHATEEGSDRTRYETLTKSGSETTNCVGVYLEVDNDIFREKGGAARTSAYMLSLFNQVATLYERDGIDIRLSSLFFWKRNDPYNSRRANETLIDFRQQRTDFPGDVAAYVSYRVGGGIGYIDALCDPSRSYSVSGIDSSFSELPDYSFAVNVLAHEIGHNLGSPHTHACVWNGNGTAIDGCFPTSGGCTPPEELPSGGGTIMSYCNLTSTGIDFRNGFGPQPSALIRRRVADAHCLATCSEGSDNDEVCTPVSIAIRTDDRPRETAWAIRTIGDSTIAFGGNYSYRRGKYSQDLCLPAGCYYFTITDLFGDGICCDLGEGAFKFSIDGQPRLVGGDFGRSASYYFCLPDGVPQTIGAFPDPEDLIVFPNPASGRVNVSGRVQGLEVFDCYGRNVAVPAGQSPTGTVLDVSGLAPGTYVLRAGSRVRKLVVTN